MVWAPQDWGDWLVWDGPADLKVFANSAAAILPRQVRYDYSQISGGESTWSGLLDQYDVGVLVIDKQRQPRLMRAALRNGQNWRIALGKRSGIGPHKKPGKRCRGKRLLNKRN